MSFHDLIRQTERRVSQLHTDVHDAFRQQQRSSRHKARWQEAARRFREHVSPIDDLMNRCQSEPIESSGTLRECALDFLECDPMYFGSGYFKELVLDRLKGACLTKAETERLHKIMLDAVRRRGGREFRHYCRLAARIAGPGLLDEVSCLAISADPGIRSRAGMMRRYIEKHGHAPELG